MAQEIKIEPDLFDVSNIKTEDDENEKADFDYCSQDFKDSDCYNEVS